MATRGNSSQKNSKKNRKKGQQSIFNGALYHIPEDLIIEIASRLPVESLIRFKTACKKWYAMFSDTTFADRYLEMSNSRLIVFGEDPDVSCKSWELDSVFSNVDDDCGVDLDFPMKELIDDNFYVVGSSGGILCLCFQKSTIYLWNPFLRESRKLPKFDSDLLLEEEDEDYANYVYGFGYDQSINDYTVVGMVYVQRLQVFSVTEVNVFNLKTTSWRRIGEYPEKCAPLLSKYGGHGVCIDGVLHWLSDYHEDQVEEDDDDDDDDDGVAFWNVIHLKNIALDLSTETFHDIVLPEHNNTNNLVLGSLQGFLCVLIDHPDTKLIDLWMMKDYGDSWSIMASFPYTESLPLQHILYILYQSPLFLCKRDVLLWKFKYLLNLYDLKEDTCQSLVFNDYFSRIREAVICVESLVSPYEEGASTRRGFLDADAVFELVEPQPEAADSS